MLTLGYVHTFDLYINTAVRTTAAAAAVAASTKALASDVQQENDKMWRNPNARTAADASSALAVSVHTHLCMHSSYSCRMPTSVSHSSARVLCDRLFYNNVA
jgi:hypothetical protein